MKLRDKIWLWGQTPGSHHYNNVYNLPGVNKMTPKQGAEFFGIENIFRVKMSVDSQLSFEKEMDDLAESKRIMFSIIGSGSCDSQRDDTGEIIALAKKYPNIVGGIMDDFVSEVRLEIYTPQKLAAMRQKLHSAIPGRSLEFWSVIYERDLDKDITDNVRQFDHVTFWTWYSEKLFEYQQNFAAIKKIIAPGQKLMLGVYLYDYGSGRPMTAEEMDFQLNFVLQKFKSREIDGIVICSNCNADLGFDTVDKMKAWIDKYGDMEL